MNNMNILAAGNSFAQWDLDGPSQAGGPQAGGPQAGGGSTDLVVSQPQAQAVTSFHFCGKSGKLPFFLFAFGLWNNGHDTTNPSL